MSVPAPLGILGDDRLARLAGEGNERAFSTLYGRFHQPLYRYCYSMLRQDADAQDALQSTFASALVALRRGQRDAPLRPWLFRIAHNESISLLRKRRSASELSETMESPALSVEATADGRAQLAQLVADLQELPERQRGALVMRELNGLSHEELAQALGISVGAAKQTVFEARRALAEFEEGRAMACDDIQRVISDGDRRALRARRVRAHMRECSGCSTFAAAIPERRAALLALSPALPAAAAAGLLSRVTGGAASAHHGGSGLLAGAASKGVGAAVSTKALVAGVAIVATAAAGTAGIVKVVTSSGHPARPAAARTHALTSGSAISSAIAAGRAVSRLSGPSAGRSSAASPPRQGGHGSGAAKGRGIAAGGASRSSIARSGSASLLVPAGSTATGQSSGPSSGQGASQSNPSTTNPNSHGGNPNAGGTNAGSGSSNPNAHGGNPNAGSGSSNSHGGNPNAHGGNPNAGGNNAGLGSSNPNAHGGNPNSHSGAGTSTTSTVTTTTTTTTTTGSSNSHHSNPNAGGANSHGRGHS